MATVIQILTTNYSGETAQITFTPCSGGTIDLGSQVLPYNYESDNYQGAYSLYFSAFAKTCTFEIPCPTLEPTQTPTNTPTPTPTLDVDCLCPSGYTASNDGSICYRVLTSSPTVNDTLQPEAGADNNNYGQFGVKIYNVDDYDISGNTISGNLAFSGFTVVADGSSTTDVELFYSTRMNANNVWVAGNANWPEPNYPDYISFCSTFTLLESKTYYVGIAGDNDVTIKLNGITLVDQPGEEEPDTNFKFWHVYPVTLNAGPNIIELLNWNRSQVGSFAAEIYDNTLSEMTSATGTTMLNIVFATGDYLPGGSKEGEGFCSNYTCPSGYYLDTIDPQNPICKLIETTSCTNTTPTPTPTSTDVPPTPTPTSTDVPPTPTPTPTDVPPTPTPTPTDVPPTPTPTFDGFYYYSVRQYDCSNSCSVFGPDLAGRSSFPLSTIDGVFYKLISEINVFQVQTEITPAPMSYDIDFDTVIGSDVDCGQACQIGITPTSTPTPTATDVPPTPTATDVPPTPTPTSTPTPTATDVPPTATPTPTPTSFTAFNGKQHNGSISYNCVCEDPTTDDIFYINGTDLNDVNTVLYFDEQLTQPVPNGYQYKLVSTDGFNTSYVVTVTPGGGNLFVYDCTTPINEYNGMAYPTGTTYYDICQDPFTNMVYHVDLGAPLAVGQYLWSQTCTPASPDNIYKLISTDGFDTTYIVTVEDSIGTISSVTECSTIDQPTPTPTSTDVPPTPTPTSTPVPPPPTQTPTPTPTATLNCSFNVDVNVISATPTPTSTDVPPTPTPTPTPTSTDVPPTPTPTPTDVPPTPTPSSTPTSTPTPTPTSTPVPPTPTPTSTDVPPTPTPTSTPVPPTPTSTPVPPTPTPTPTDVPTISVNIHTSQPSGYLACNGGTPISVQLNGSTFCNTTVYTSSYFTSLGTTTYWLSYEGNYRQIFHSGSQNTATQGGSCQTCDNTAPTATPTPTPTATPDQTANWVNSGSYDCYGTCNKYNIETDINQYSPTYNQTKQGSLVESNSTFCGGCCGQSTVANWVNDTTACDGFTLYNIERDINGCSATFNQTRRGSDIEYNSPSCGYTPPPTATPQPTATPEAVTFYQYLLGPSYTQSSQACDNVGMDFYTELYAATNVASDVLQFFIDTSLTIGYTGESEFHAYYRSEGGLPAGLPYVARISGTGLLSDKSLCS